MKKILMKLKQKLKMFDVVTVAVLFVSYILIILLNKDNSIPTNLVNTVNILITIFFSVSISLLSSRESTFAWKKTKTVEYSPYVDIKIKKSEANYQVTFKNTGRGELYNLNIMFEKESLLKTILELDINFFDYGVNLRQNEEFTFKIVKDKNDTTKNDTTTQIIESIILTYEDLLGQPYSQNIRIICLDSKEVVCLSQKPFIIDNPYTKNRTF